MLKITIETDQPGLEKAMAAFVAALNGGKAVAATSETTATKTTKVTEVTEKAGNFQPKADPEKGEQPVITIEEVRAKLYELSQNGKRPLVEQLINSFGATSLLKVDPSRLSELYAKACEL